MRMGEMIVKCLRITFLRADEIATLIGLSESDTEMELLALKSQGLVSSHSHGNTVWWSLTKAAKEAELGEREKHDNSAFTLKSPHLKEFRRFKKRATRQEQEDQESTKSWVEWSKEVQSGKAPVAGKKSV